MTLRCSETTSTSSLLGARPSSLHRLSERRAGTSWQAQRSWANLSLTRSHESRPGEAAVACGQGGAAHDREAGRQGDEALSRADKFAKGAEGTTLDARQDRLARDTTVA